MKKTLNSFKSQLSLQAMVIPSIILMIIFCYIPMLGLIIAFQEYSPIDGFSQSVWVGLNNFKDFLTDPEFYEVLTNTLGISFLKLIVVFPMEIILAILLNELRNAKFKVVVQTIGYLPHFFSWVILGGMLISWFSSTGLVNNVLTNLNIIDKPLSIINDPNSYWIFATLSDAWKEVGWGTILFVAAMTSIEPSQYEAAKIDGASKLQSIWHVTLPGISKTIALMFVLKVSLMLNTNLDQTLVLQNSSNFSKSEVINSYVYHYGITQGDFSFATAIGIFASVISVILLLVSNFFTKRVTDESIF